MADTKDIEPRMLMGPGPSDVNPRVLRAMARPTIGHLDGQFLEILNDIRDMLQAVFQTGNNTGKYFIFLTCFYIGSTDYKWGACLINKEIINLINNGIILLTLHAVG